MSAEFGAIERLLKSGKRKAQRNKVWSQIHEQTGFGLVSGREFQFSREEIQRLREYARTLTGLDPLFESTKGSRMELSEKTQNEKLARTSVFGDLIVMATAGQTEVVVNGRRTSTPPGSLLSVDPKALSRQELARTNLVIIENGALMSQWQDIALPERWANSILMYRGHRENVRHVRNFIAEQPSDRLAHYYDFDPEGLEMALASGKGEVLVPKEWQVLTGQDECNQRTVFRRQQSSLKRIQRDANAWPWSEIVQVMTHGELAIMQEHITSRHWPLAAYPSV
jgi:hypothetical protein